MTIHELLAAAGLNAGDEIPIWQVNSADEPTRKITAQQFASALITLGSLITASQIANDLSTTTAGKVLDARQGKTLKDIIEALTPADIGALPDSTTIPSKTSELTNDSGFITSTAIAGKKNTQSPVSSPTASGNAVSFIDSITQNAQGVITPTKKIVPTATTTAPGLMSATDKAKLDGLDMLGFYIGEDGGLCQSDE